MALKQKPSQMDKAQFTATFADIYEESPWVAERAHSNGITPQHDTPSALAAAMRAIVEQAGEQAQHTLIMAHPVLGTKKKMGDHSTQEQKSANLADMQDNDAQQLRDLNNAYMQKFSIPFIMAVKGATPPTIIAALQQRLQNDSTASEQRRALDEIHKIAAFRLEALWGE